MEQSKTVGSSKPGVAGKTPGKKKSPSNLTQEIHQKGCHHPDGLDKYFQILPFVESFLNETNPQLKRSNGIFFTPYPVVSFIVRSIHTILKKKLGKPLGLADETVNGGKGTGAKTGAKTRHFPCGAGGLFARPGKYIALQTASQTVMNACPDARDSSSNLLRFFSSRG